MRSSRIISALLTPFYFQAQVAQYCHAHNQVEAPMILHPGCVKRILSRSLALLTLVLFAIEPRVHSGPAQTAPAGIAQSVTRASSYCLDLLMLRSSLDDRATGRCRTERFEQVVVIDEESFQAISGGREVRHASFDVQARAI